MSDEQQPKPEQSPEGACAAFPEFMIFKSWANRSPTSSAKREYFQPAARGLPYHLSEQITAFPGKKLQSVGNAAILRFLELTWF